MLRKPLIFFAFISLFTQCGKKTYYLKSIENTTDNDVEIYWVRPLGSAYIPSVDTIWAGTSFSLDDRIERGLKPQEDCMDGIDTLRFYVIDSQFPDGKARFTLNWTRDQSWESRVIEQKSYAEYSCKLVIDSTDFLRVTLSE